MDLLQSGTEDEARPLGPRLRAAAAGRLPPWAVAVVAGLLAVALAVGAGTAVDLRDQQAAVAARLDVDVLGVDSRSSTVGRASRGELSLLLVNRRDRRVRLGALRVAVEGLRVERVEPPFGQPLAAFEERIFRIAFVVPDCRRLVLPGAVVVSLATDGQPLQRRQIPVREAASGASAIVLAACPPTARGPDPGVSTDVAARPAGGSAQRVGAGAEGVTRLEIRNGGQPLRLLSVTAEIPGVDFGTLRLDGGRTLETDGLVIVRLSFRIEDCAVLEYAGRLVLSVERFGAVQEVGLRAPKAAALLASLR